MRRVCIYQRYMPPDRSGAGKQALAIAQVLEGAGWGVIFATDADPARERGSLNPYPALRVTPPPPDPSYPQLFRYWGRVGSALYGARHEFDVVHVHSAAFDQVAAVPLARALGKRVLVRSSIAGEFAHLGASRSGRLQRRLLHLADAFVVLSESLRREIIRSGLPASKVSLIPNGVDTKVYHPVTEQRRTELRRELDLPEDGRLLIFHGVFMERKRVDWLVRTVGPVLAELDLHLLLVGGPARDDQETGYARRLKRTIGASPARSRIIVRRHQPEVQRYLQAADAYVLPSTGEGLPNALLEAMAVGLVPFATRTSGSEDVIRHEEHGFLFPPDDPRGLLDALRATYGSQPGHDPAALSAAAVERIRSRFTIDVTAMQYAEIYERMLR